MKQSIHSKLITCVLIILVLSVAEASVAQIVPRHSFVLSLALDAGVPVPKAKTGSVFALGGDMMLQYGITDRFVLTFATGGYHFFPEKILGIYGYGRGPVKFGVRAFFTPNLYFGVEAGVAYEATKEGLISPPKFLLAPAFGYATKHWDYSVRFENYSGQNRDIGLIAMRLAYGFKL